MGMKGGYGYLLSRERRWEKVMPVLRVTFMEALGLSPAPQPTGNLGPAVCLGMGHC